MPVKFTGMLVEVLLATKECTESMQLDARNWNLFFQFLRAMTHMTLNKKSHRHKVTLV